MIIAMKDNDYISSNFSSMLRYFIYIYIYHSYIYAYTICIFILY